MRKIIIFFIILTIIGTVSLVAINLRKDSSHTCLLYTSPSPRDPKTSRMPSSA